MLPTNAEQMRKERAPLYHHYEGQTNPQPAVLTLSCEDKTLTARVDGNIGGGTHMEAWLGRDREVRIPNTLTGQEVADLLESEKIQGFAARILAGYSEDWSKGDRRGVLTDEAYEAYLELDRYCQDLEGSLVVWNGDWLGDAVDGPKATSTDEEIEVLARNLTAVAESDGVYLDFHMIDELKRRREILREDAAADVDDDV